MICIHCSAVTRSLCKLQYLIVTVLTLAWSLDGCYCKYRLTQTFCTNAKESVHVFIVQIDICTCLVAEMFMILLCLVRWAYVQFA